MTPGAPLQTPKWDQGKPLLGDFEAQLSGVGGSGAGEHAESIVERLQPLVSQVRLILLVRSIAWTIAGGVLILVAFLGFDWWQRPGSVAGRVALSLLFVGAMTAFGFGCWYFFWRRRPTLESVSRRFESLFPELGDRLSSAVAMERGNQGGAESPLVSAAIQSVTQQFVMLRPERAIDWRSAVWSIVGALLVLLALASIAGVRPGLFSMATSRLFQPTREVLWPQRDHLVFDQLPSMTIRGKSLQWFVRNQGGFLPEDLVVHYRDAGMREGDDPKVLAVRQNGIQGIIEIENVQESFSVRAFGGDDDSMAWQAVEVDDGVEVEEYSIRLVPPAYSGLTELSVQSREIAVLTGTKMYLNVRATAGIESASLVFEPEDPSNQNLPEERSTAAIDRSAKSLEFGPIELLHSGRWRLDWVDDRGIEVVGQDRWDVEVQEDTIPFVQLLDPETDREVTAEAVVNLSRVSEDDFGIRTAWFQVEYRNAGQVIRRDQRQFEDAFPKTEQAEMAFAITDGVDDGLRSIMLQPGAVVEVKAVAEDTAGQRGESSAILLRVVSRDRIETRIAEEMSDAIKEIVDARNQQKIALEQTEASKARIADNERAIEEVLDRLRGAESAQVAAEQRLVGESASALEHLENARQFAKENGIDPSAMEQLTNRLRDLVNAEMVAGQNAIDEASEAIRERDLQRATDQLEQAISRQQASIQSLQDLSGELRQGDLKRELALELETLLAEQKRLSRETSQMQSATDSVNEQNRLAQRQRDLARQTNELIEQLESFAADFEEGNSSDETQAREAADVLLGEEPDRAEQQGARPLESVMRDAAEALADGRAGQSRQLQDQAERQLDRARQVLRGNRRPVPGQGEGEETGQVFQERLEELIRRQEMLAGVDDEAINAQWSRDEFAIALETRELSKVPSPAGVSAVLNDAAVDMEMAAALAERSGEVDVVIETAAAALRRLELVLDALARAAADSGEEGQDSERGDASQEDSEDRPRIALESLRLARGMQAFLKERTQQLDREAKEIESGGEQSTDWIRNRQQRRAVADEQLRLAERLSALLQSMESPNDQSTPPSTQEPQSTQEPPSTQEP